MSHTASDRAEGEMEFKGTSFDWLFLEHGAMLSGYIQMVHNGACMASTQICMHCMPCQVSIDGLVSSKSLIDWVPRHVSQRRRVSHRPTLVKGRAVFMKVLCVFN